ncbi:AAA family ATPase [bacterium]|nr:AAA family ATPase [bacterium]
MKKECDISSKTNEYKNITFETIINFNKQSIHDQYETYKTQYKTLKTFPSNIDNILPIKKEFYIKNFQNFENLFQKEYTLNNFSKEFRDKIQGKFEFVKSGTELLNQNNKLNCPFCEQEMNDNAIKLIDEYNKFLHDEQTTIIEELKSFSNELKNIKELYLNFLLDCSKTENLIIEISNYFPSLKNKKFFKFENKENLDTIIDNLLQLTNKKGNNISESIDIHEDITKLNNFSKDFENIINKNNGLIEEINESVSKKDKEKLTIKKNICLAVINKVVDESKELIKQYNVITNKINDLNANIKELEQTCKKSKRDFILEYFEKLLKAFFANKYQFDKNTSKFKFLEHDITNNTNYVFSEGEKNIVAFCYYLASVYNVVQNEKDLDKVFYIIDDPISSVDYLYIYKIAQIIKEDKHIKHKLILTHSLEFVNVLSKQKVVNFFILLNKGKFYQMSSRIYPYFNHLFDIYNISINASEPTHTTLNSIRNILESIISFVSPKTNLDEFIKKQIPGFDETPELCLLINHFSHGIISENEEVYTNEQIKIICKKLIEYINCVFPGQIDMLENMKKN